MMSEWGTCEICCKRLHDTGENAIGLCDHCALENNRLELYNMIVNTPHGNFNVKRKGTVAISVVRTRHRVIHHRILLDSDSITFIEHRRVPTNIYNVKIGFSSWATYMATYDLNGCEIKLSCCKLNI